MYALWCYLIYGFIPKWKILEEKKLEGEAWDGRRAYVGKVYYLQCEQTGKVKRKVFL